jgi:hypothetical protein
MMNGVLVACLLFSLVADLGGNRVRNRPMNTGALWTVDCGLWRGFTHEDCLFTSHMSQIRRWWSMWRHPAGKSLLERPFILKSDSAVPSSS